MIRKLAEKDSEKSVRLLDKKVNSIDLPPSVFSDSRRSLPIIKDGEKPVIVRKPQEDRSKLKVDPTGSRLSRSYKKYKKILMEEFENE